MPVDSRRAEISRLALPAIAAYLWSRRGIGGEDFAMTRIGDHPYRGIEYGIHRDNQGEWHWTYYPKMGHGVRETGKVEGTREMAISACKAEIDKWLDP